MPDDPLSSEQDRPFFTISDTLAAVPKGFGSAILDVYRFADTIAFDTLPDVPKYLDEGLEAETDVGAFVHGVANFASAFVPVAGWLGKGGKVVGGIKLAGALSARTERAAKIAAYAAKGAGNLSDFRKYLSAARRVDYARAMTAGAITDALVFGGHEQRLSNWLADANAGPFTGLVQGFGQALQAEDDDPEILGRLKNAAEGLALGPIVDVGFWGIRTLAKGRRLYRNGVAPEEVARQLEPQHAKLAEALDAVEAEKTRTTVAIDAQERPTTQLLEPAQEAAPKKIYELSPEEIIAENSRIKISDREMEDSILGSRADAWRKAQRRSNSSNDAVSDAAMREINDIEASLSQKDKDSLYGIGEAYDREQLDDYAKSIQNLRIQNEADIQDVTKFVQKDFIALGGVSNPEAMTHAEQLALFRLKYVYSQLEAMGHDRAAFTEKALMGAAGQFEDPEDALFVLDRFTKRSTAGATPSAAAERPTTQIPANAESEKIVAAASRWGGKVFTGINHGETYEKVVNAFPERPKLFNPEDGFVTNKGRFINRDEAAKLFRETATNQDQAIINTYGLGSEQLNKQSKAVSANAGTAASAVPQVLPKDPVPAAFRSVFNDDAYDLLKRAYSGQLDNKGIAELAADPDFVKRFPEVEQLKMAPARMSPDELALALLRPGNLNTSYSSMGVQGVASQRALSELSDWIFGLPKKTPLREEFSKGEVWAVQEALGNAKAADATRVAAHALGAEQVTKLAIQDRLHGMQLEAFLEHDLKPALQAARSGNDQLLKLVTVDKFYYYASVKRERQAFATALSRAMNSRKIPLKSLSPEVAEKLRMKGLAEKAGKLTPDEAMEYARILAEDQRKQLERAGQKYVPSSDLAGDADAIARRFDQMGGERTIGKMLDAIEGAIRSGTTPQEQLAALGRVAANRWRPGFIDFTLEAYIGNILSGLKTPVTVANAQALYGLVYKPAMVGLGSGVGSALRRVYGDAQGASLMAEAGMEALSEWRFMSSALRDSVKLANMAFSDHVWGRSGTSGFFPDEGVLEHGAKITKANLADFFERHGFDPEGALAKGITWLMAGIGAKDPDKNGGLGALYRLFPGVLAWTDELTKQVVGRSVAASQLLLEANRIYADAAPDMKPLLVAKHMDDGLEKIIRDGTLATEHNLRIRASQQATTQGLTGKERSRFIKEYMERELAENPGVMSQIQYVERRAHEAAATTPLPPNSVPATLVRLTQQFPPLKFVAPFIKSPYNILRTGGQHLDAKGIVETLLVERFPGRFQNLEKSRNMFIRDFTSNDPRRHAEALGRASMGLVFMLGVLELATRENENGMPRITGTGPSDPAERKILSEAGWQQFSVWDPVGKKYVSFARLDPFATILGSLTDLAHFSRYAQDEDQPLVMQAMTAGWYSMVNQLKDKRYLLGLAKLMDALDDPTGAKFSSMMRQTVGSIAVPNFVAQGAQGVEDLAGDAYSRDARGFIDEILKRIPFAAESVPVRRNVLGEPMEKPKYLGPDWLSPFQYNEPTDSVVKRELANQGASFRAPRPKKGPIDLREIVNEAGVSAYDRWQELVGTTRIDGLTLKASLRRLFMSPEYRTLPYTQSPGETSVRESLTANTLERYRSRAYQQTVLEYPELRRAEMAQHYRKQAQMLPFTIGAR